MDRRRRSTLSSEEAKALILQVRTDPNNWVHLDDGVPGGSRGYFNIVTKAKIRHRPVGFQEKCWSHDGTRAYTFFGRCTDCLEDMTSMPEPSSIFHDSRALCFLLCPTCVIKVAQRIRMYGECGSTRQAMKKRSMESDLPPFDPTPLMGLNDVEVLYTIASGIIPKCLDVDLLERMADDDREQAIETKALEAQNHVLEDMAQRRMEERRRWMTNRCAREFNMTNGEFKRYDQGHGTEAFYLGDVQMGLPNGRGLLTWWPDGAEYYGHFVNGLRHGSKPSSFLWPDGRKYVGSWFNDKMHGRGVITYPDGTVFEGVFAVGRKNGKGIISYPDGSFFRGRYHQGGRAGKGISTTALGNKEVGKYDEKPVQENEKDPVNLRIPFKPPSKEPEANAATAGRHQPSTPSLVLKCQQVAGAGIRLRHDKFSPDIIQENVPRHLRPALAQALLDGDLEASPAFKAAAPAVAWQELTSVNVSGRRLNSRDVTLLSHMLGGRTCHTLQMLKLVGDNIQSDRVITVASILQHARVLTEVDLSYNSLGKEGISILAKALQQQPCITRFAIAGCSLGAKGTEAFCSIILNTSTCQLTDVDLSFNDMKIEGAAAIGQALKRNRSLLRLNLRSNHLGPKGGILLSEALSKNNGYLQMLIVEDNHMGERVAGLLASRNKTSVSQVLKGFATQRLYVPQTVPLLSREE